MNSQHIKIPVANRNDRKTFGRFRLFKIAELVPLLRRKIVRWLEERLLSNDNDRNKFINSQFDLNQGAKLLDKFLTHIESKDMLSQFLAFMIIPDDDCLSKTDHNEIAGFLERNILPAKEAEILSAFFTQIAMDDLAIAVKSMIAIVNYRNQSVEGS